MLILFLFPTHVYAASGSADTYTVIMQVKKEFS